MDIKNIWYCIKFYSVPIFRFIFPKIRELRAYESGDSSVYTFETFDQISYVKVECPFKDSECKVTCAYYSVKRGKIRCGKHVMGKLR